MTRNQDEIQHELGNGCGEEIPYPQDPLSEPQRRLISTGVELDPQLPLLPQHEPRTQENQVHRGSRRKELTSKSRVSFQEPDHITANTQSTVPNQGVSSSLPNTTALPNDRNWDDSSTTVGHTEYDLLPPNYRNKLESANKARNNILNWKNHIDLARRGYRERRHTLFGSVKRLEEIATRFETMVRMTPHMQGQTLNEDLRNAILEIQKATSQFGAADSELQRSENTLESAELRLSEHERLLSKKEKELLGHSTKTPEQLLQEQFPLRPLAPRAKYKRKPKAESSSDSSSDEQPSYDQSPDGSIHSEEQDATQEDESLSAFSGSSEQNDPLEYDYYDHIGNVTLARDHLYNIQTDLLQSRYAREEQRREGRIPSIPEAQFWRDYFHERRKLIQEYVSSKHQVGLLYKLCKAKGLDIEEPNLPPMPESTLDHSIRDVYLPFRLGGANSVTSSAEMELDIAIEDPLITRQRRVTDWRNNVIREGSSLDYADTTPKLIPWFDGIAESPQPIVNRPQHNESEMITSLESPSSQRPNISLPGSQPVRQHVFYEETIRRRYSNPILRANNPLNKHIQKETITLRRRTSFTSC